MKEPIRYPGMSSGYPIARAAAFASQLIAMENAAALAAAISVRDDWLRESLVCIVCVGLVLRIADELSGELCRRSGPRRTTQWSTLPRPRDKSWCVLPVWDGWCKSCVPRMGMDAARGWRADECR